VPDSASESPEDLPDSWVERSKYLRKNTNMTWEKITEQIKDEYGSEAPNSRKWVGVKTREKIKEGEESEGEKKEPENTEDEEKNTDEQKEDKEEQKDTPKPNQRDRVAEIEGEEELDDNDIEIEMDGKTSDKLPSDPRLIFLFILWIVAIIMLVAFV
jgi:hypothetical protein